MKRLNVICECGSLEHQLLFVEIEEDLYVYVHLSKKPLWSRIVTAIKHVLGHRSRFGDWDEFMFCPKELKKLKTFIK